jgi:plasmid stabilization system protein ParE
MAGDFRLEPTAETDVAEAYAWYERQRHGLGEQFLQCVDECIQRTVRMPKANRCVYEEYRRALVRRFPYSVFYEFDGSLVTIYSVMHTARDPKKWRQRLP